MCLATVATGPDDTNDDQLYHKNWNSQRVQAHLQVKLLPLSQHVMAIAKKVNPIYMDFIDSKSCSKH